MMGFVTKKDYKNTSRPLTVCVHCKFHVDKGSDSRRFFWHKHLCSAKKGDKIFNTVTGEWVEQELPHCAHINDGNCKLYKRK